MLTFAEVNEIVKTLPIGYYLGARINAQLSETCKASYYDPMNYRIVISYPMLADIMDDNSIEEDARCLLYHEVSHTMLTPKDLYSCAMDIWYAIYKSKTFRVLDNNSQLQAEIKAGKYPNINTTYDYILNIIKPIYEDKPLIQSLINVFEDQRIETLNKGIFLKVDFPNFIKKVSKYDPNDKGFKNFYEFFYRIVRFNDIEPEIVKLVYDAIYDSYELNANSKYYAQREYGGRILDVIFACYIKYKVYEQLSQQSGQSQQSNQQNGNQQSSPNGTPSNSSDQSDEDNLEAGNGNQEDEDESEDSADGQNESDDSEDESDNQSSESQRTNNQDNSQDLGKHAKGVNDQELQDIIKDALEKHGFQGEDIDDAAEQLAEVLKEEFSKQVINQYNCTPKFSSQAEQYILRMLKKKSIEAKSLAGYSGRINPKNVHRVGRVETYRWFDKPNPNGLNATAGKFRINFFCDNSGSFDSNKNVANSIIRSLWQLSKKHAAFEFTLVTHGNRHVVRTDANMAIECNEGTDIYPEVFQIYHNLQKQGQTIWNFVLFDGGVNCKESIPRYKVWNHQNVIMICDTDDKLHIEKYCPKAKKIFTSNYCEELEENILKCMDQMFR